MVSLYRIAAQHMKQFIDTNFKPFSELIDCRRYSFPKQNIFNRFQSNFNYFSYNYLAIAILVTILYLVQHIWFSIGLFLTVAFWGMVYCFRQRIIDISANDMCYNVKMTLFLIVNSLLLWNLYGSTILEYIGYITFPIVIHSILFEPIDILDRIQLQKKDSIDHNYDLEIQQQSLSSPSQQEQLQQQKKQEYSQEQQYQQTLQQNNQPNQQQLQLQVQQEQSPKQLQQQQQRQIQDDYNNSINSLHKSNNSSISYNSIIIQESSQDIIINENKMSDEQAQAYQHVIQNESNSTHR